jgi:hypothetical protein
MAVDKRAVGLLQPSLFSAAPICWACTSGKATRNPFSNIAKQDTETTGAIIAHGCRWARANYQRLVPSSLSPSSMTTPSSRPCNPSQANSDSSCTHMWLAILKMSGSSLDLHLSTEQAPLQTAREFGIVCPAHDTAGLHY